MKRQLILCFLILAAIFLCSCSSQSAFNETVSYKEAELYDYTKLNNTNAVLMFKSSSDNEELGELYIKSFDNAEEKIADKVYRNNYMLLNGNDVIYVDTENTLYIKKYGKEASKIDVNVDFYSIYVSSKNAILYSTYEDKDFIENYYDLIHKEILLDDKGNKHVISESKNYVSYSFSEDGSFLYALNDFGTLKRIDLKGKIEVLAGNVSNFSITADGSAYAYITYNNRLYIKWPGADKPSYIKNLDVYADYDYFSFSSNGLSYVFTAYDDNADMNLMFVTPFSEPVIIANEMYRASLNNDYLYAFDGNNDLYGYKLPKITPKTKSEDLTKQLEGLEGKLIGTDIMNYAVSYDGRSISYTNSDYELYSSYDFADAVKIQDDVIYVGYILDAIVFKTQDSKLYINGEYTDMNKISSSAKEICGNSDAVYAEENFSDYFIYSDEKSDIYIYSTKDNSKLILDNTKEYSYVKSKYTNIYFKSLEINDISGFYSCENYSNSYDNFVMQINNDNIVLVLDNYSGKRNISLINSTEATISFADEEGYVYYVHKDGDKLSLEIYDEDVNSFYQYEVTSINSDEFNEKLEKAQLEMRYDFVYDMLMDYYYDGYTASEALPMYKEYSLDSEIVGYIAIGQEYYVINYYVEDDYNFWLCIEDTDTMNYVWIYIDTSNIMIEN